jgi:hypothetical protein
VRAGSWSPWQAQVHAGRVEVDAMFGDNGARQVAARALGLASTGVVRTNEPVEPSRLGCLQELATALGGG